MSESVAAARPVDQLIDAYAQSHRNPVNEVIHFICVPAIVLSALGLLWTAHPLLATAAAAAAVAYYATLSMPMAAGMLAAGAAMLALLTLIPAKLVLPLAIAIFVVAWIGQFIGHKIEGKKPSFLDDLRFLLIGPLFVLSFIYRRFHVRY